MSVTKKLLEASGGSGGESTYVDDVFQTTLTEGLGNETIVNGMDLADKGALIWQKSRIQSSPHYLYDSERGAGKALSSNASDAEQNFGSSGVQSWNSNGWTAGSGGSSSGNTTAQWVFAKQKGFFDIVTYTGNDVAGRQIPHNLGSTPGMIWIKRLTGGDNWQVFHKDLSNPLTKLLILNSNAAEANQSTSPQFPAMPTDTVFSVGDDTAVNYGGSLGGSAQDYVAYVFAHDAQEFGPDGDESIIKCGSYVGTGNDSTAPEIDLGWEPQWLLVKNASYGGTSWTLLDNMRGWTTNDSATDAKLYANATRAESLDRLMGITSTGFFPEGADPSTNGNGNTHIYMAIRRPMKPAEEFDPEELFDVGTYAGNNSTLASAIEFPFNTDMFMLKRTDASGKNHVFNRLTEYPLTGANQPVSYLATSETAALSDAYTFRSGDARDITIAQDGSTNLNVSGGTYINYGWRRAPGFFDVVTYEGDGTTGGIAHNLAAVPEMYWIKRRDYADGQGWMVYHKDAVATTAANAQSSYLTLNSGDLVAANTNRFGNIAPTNTTFGVSSSSANETGADYIAFLWASVPGICDIGSYTGTGADIDIDCGFTNGARFVLIKRADDVSDWYYWDSLRGITSGADSRLALNNTNAASTTSDWIDPLPSGFTVENSAGNDVNINGGTYIYMAIA